MDISWQLMAYIFEFLLIIVCIFMMKETIISKYYGVRFKRWIELDTGRYGYTILDKGLDSCDIMGQKKSVSRKNIKNNWMFFVNDNAENLVLEDAKDKWQFYCNSEEFDTVYKNENLRKLMLILNNNILLMIIVLIMVSIVIGIYIAYNDYSQMQPKIDWIMWKVNQTDAGY